MARIRFPFKVVSREVRVFNINNHSSCGANGNTLSNISSDTVKMLYPYAINKRQKENSTISTHGT